MDNQAVDSWDLNTRGASPRLPARRLVMPIIALALDVIPALILLLSLLYFVESIIIGAFVLLLAGIGAGVYSYIKKKKGLGITAIVISTIALCVLLAGMIEFGIGFGVALFLAVISPIVGTALGISSLCMGKKRMGTAGIVIAAIAAALPILVIGTIILLVQTGAMVISLM